MAISKISEFWPGWSIIDTLGEGAYGKVYKAIKSEGGFDTYAAIKVVSVPSSTAELKSLRAEGLSEEESKTYFHGIVNDFINEIKLMENLKGAPNIVSVEDYKILERTDTIGWNIYIRMELLQPFDDFMTNNKPSEKDILQVGIDLCSGLEICNKYRIIHRDIKPANIFVSKFGDFKLGDFGIAKELEKTSSAMSSKGTYSYMAPEVAHGLRYDATVDIYSLGIVLYTLLNNNRQPFLDPFSAQISYNDRKNAADRRLSGEPLPPPCNASPELAAIIMSACSYSARGRFKNPTAFKNALIAYRDGKSVPLSTFIPQDPPKPLTPTIPAPPQATQPPKSSGAAPMVSNYRLKELYPETKKKKSKGKGMISLLVSLVIIAAIILAATIFIPDKNNTEGTVFSPENNQTTEEVKELRIGIKESPRTTLSSVVPGEVINVDPYVNVYADSGDCWLFVELYMTKDFDEIFEYELQEHWISLEGYDNVYYTKVNDSVEDQSFGIFKNDSVSVPETTDYDLSSADIQLEYSSFALHTNQANDAVIAWKKIISAEGYSPIQVNDD